MFSDRNSLPAAQQELIRDLEALDYADVEKIRSSGHNYPTAYIRFMKNFGAGKIRGSNEPANFPAHFKVLAQLKSAEKEYFQDKQIYEHGAKGDVMIFGLEGTGICYGFDTGDANALVQIDNFQLVTKLAIDFDDFIFGILACYPDFPEKYKDGCWENDLGEKFSMSELS